MPESGQQHRPAGFPGAIPIGERRGTWYLEVQGRRIELREGETTLGRSRGCGVVVKDPAVSRDHALIWVHGGRVTVQDLQSSNGTYLNGHRVHAETAMAESDRLTVGETQAYLRLGRDDRRRPAPGDAAPGFCPTCGAAVPAAAKRCPSCDRDLEGERLLHRSEAIGMGEVLPVGEALGTASDAWDLTRPPGFSAEALGHVPTPPPPRLAAVPPPPDAGEPPSPPELLPSVDDLERVFALLDPPPPAVPASGEAGVAAPELPGPEAAAPIATPPASPPSAPAAAPDTAVTWHPAGFWIRAAACVLDAATVALAATLLSLPFGGPTTPRGSLVASTAAFLLSLLVPLVGWTLWGTTPGKCALHLTVVGPDARHGLSVARALLRLLGYFLSSLPFGAGFWIAAISPEKRALHDHLAGTTVLHRTSG
jgi:uncharacterized RDD family membrane protein YckC